MPPKYQQVSGSGCSLTLYTETSPGVVASGAKGVRLAFMSESFARGSSKKQRRVISGKRGPGKPYDGLPQFSGQVEAAAYSNQLGFLLKALCGKVTTTTESDRVLDTGGKASNLSPGLVGLPCKAHGFVQDAMITIHGTKNYDGSHRVAYGSTDDVIAIAAPYVSETMPAAKVMRGRAASLSGAAKNVGSGLVGLPVRDNIHYLNAGEKVIVTGTTAYNGTWILQDGTRDGLLVIKTTFAAENMAAASLAAPVFYRHSFALPHRQPTLCIEKYLDFESGAAVNKYQRFGFCKLNGFNFNFGGDDELKLSLDFTVGRQFDGTLPIDSAPLTPPAIPMDNIECALWVAGKRRGDVENGSFNNAFGIEAHAAVGDLGEYSRMPEGDPECKATLNVFLEEADYNEIAHSCATVPFSLSISSTFGDEVWFHYPETELDAPGTPITGKAGLMQEISVLALVDKGESILTAELINRVSQY